MEAVSTSETSVSFYQTTRRNIPEYSHLYTRRRENLISHVLVFIVSQASVLLLVLWTVQQSGERSSKPRLLFQFPVNQKSVGTTDIQSVHIECIPFYYNIAHKQKGRGMKTKRIWVGYMIKFIIRAKSFHLKR
jgi:hypothetical protein